MNGYELTLILRINENLDATKEIVTNILKKNGVESKSVNEWGRKKMAYIIDKSEDGFYIIHTLEASPDTIQKIIAEFRLSNDILRFLFVRLDEVKSA
jgi:small subunit ribosomal protein S6